MAHIYQFLIWLHVWLAISSVALVQTQLQIAQHAPINFIMMENA